MWLIVPRWQSISIQAKILADHLSIKSHLRDAPRDTHGATADYDDTALGTGTLTVHPWRAGPDCGKLYYNSRKFDAPPSMVTMAEQGFKI